jgi:hypothetical protein
VTAATSAEWLTAAATGSALYLPGALLILALDHKPSLDPARAVVDRLLLAVVLLLSTIPTGDHR